jgi:hypothetical protein
MTGSLLITAASLAALFVPAQAQAFDDPAAGVTIHSLGSQGSARWHGRGGRFANSAACNSGRGRSDQRGYSRCADYAETWGYYDPQINRSWDSDSFNDWWHDRPDRAFPRWVQHNEGCEPDRMWWSGNGWHC